MTCESGFYCEPCDETVLCKREPQHKGFHRDGTDLGARHAWDEYGEVEHL